MTSFQHMPLSSRAWIYQASRDFTADECRMIMQAGEQFIDQWTVHGKMMDASLEIKYNRFIIIVNDEAAAAASGCSIDKSVHFIKDLEKKLALRLLDRTQIAYKTDAGVSSCDLNTLSNKLQSGEITDRTLIFNNLVTTLSEMKTNWEIQLGDSWIRQRLNVHSA